MEKTSLWMQEKYLSNFPVLEEQITTDIVIVGGGITGITTAYNLTKEGKNVVLIEANRVGSGTSGHSTGNLYVMVQPYYSNIAKKYSEEAATAILKSRHNAIDSIEKNVIDNNLKCNFTRRPSFLYTNVAESISLLEKEIKILQSVVSVEKMHSLDIGVQCRLGYRLPNQARFNPYLYVVGLSKCVQTQGGRIYETSPVLEIKEGEHCEVRTPHGTVIAKKIIMCTHITKGIDRRQFFVAPYRSYVVAVPYSNNVEGHYWDMDAHYISSTHSLNEENTIDHLMVAGSHHKTGQASDEINHTKKIEEYISKTFKITDGFQCWSAQHYQSYDDVPYIGLLEKKNTYIATGYFADGLVYGTVAGEIISDHILNKKNPFLPLYKPNRFTLIKSQPKLTTENLNVMTQLIKDYAKPSQIKELRELKQGEGKIIKINGHKYAAYRDNADELHIVSAICTHMKCIVDWNNFEKSWDCPCHGSRFTVDGEIIEGPALEKLKKLTY